MTTIYGKKLITKMGMRAKLGVGEVIVRTYHQHLFISLQMFPYHRK